MEEFKIRHFLNEQPGRRFLNTTRWASPTRRTFVIAYDIDRIGFEDLADHFDSIWYPRPDDITSSMRRCPGSCPSTMRAMFRLRCLSPDLPPEGGSHSAADQPDRPRRTSAPVHRTAPVAPRHPSHLSHPFRGIAVAQLVPKARSHLKVVHDAGHFVHFRVSRAGRVPCLRHKPCYRQA
jgi:hypothetical protein